MYQIGWFSTGRDEAARDLLAAVHNRTASGEIKAEIAFVFCNREPGEAAESDRFLDQVKSNRIPLVCLSYQRFRASRKDAAAGLAGGLPPWRLEYDRAVMERLQDFHPNLCVLAGYMLIVGPEMCQRCDMINLHPAAPDGPSGTWQEVIWQLIEAKAKKAGVMMHLVTPELDKGPPVAYGTFPIIGEPFDRYWDEIADYTTKEIKERQGEANPLFRLIRKHGLAREFPLIIATIRAFSQGKVRITAAKKVVGADGRPVIGYNLTDELDEQVKDKLEKET